MNKGGYYNRDTRIMMNIFFILSVPFLIYIILNTGIFNQQINSFCSTRTPVTYDGELSQINTLNQQISTLKKTNNEQRLKIKELNSKGVEECPDCDFQMGYYFFGLGILLLTINWITDKKRDKKLKQRKSELDQQENRIRSGKIHKEIKQNERNMDIKGKNLQG